MNLIYLDEIINKLKKYELLGETYDINSWVIGLNEKQIDNFLNLNIELKDNLKRNKKLLINYPLLNSNHYNYDLTLINNCDEKTANYIAKIIFENPNHLTKNYHKSDIEIIKNVSDEMIKLRLLNLALYDDSKDEEHTKKMENIYITTKEGNNLNELSLLRAKLAKYVDNDKVKNVDLKKVLNNK